MGTDGNNNTPANAEGIQDQLETVTGQIDKQEAKVENASTPAEAEREQGKLDALIGKFDSLVSRLDAIDQKLAEPTVPAPEIKPEPTPATPAVETPASAPEGEQAPPRKRRMGAW